MHLIVFSTLANYYPDTIKPAIPEEIISSNLTLISNVITSLGDNIDKVQRELNYRIINVSSYVIHYNYDEDSLYKHTKDCAFKYLRNRNCKNYLLFDTYGGNDPRPKLMNCLINYSKAGKAIGLGGISAVDPTTGLWNGFKHLASQKFKNSKLQNLQKKTEDTFVNNPLKKSFTNGVSRVKNEIERYGLNPVSADMNKIASEFKSHTNPKINQIKTKYFEMKFPLVLPKF